MSNFWPAGEASQADYERLRATIVATGKLPDDLACARFGRRGLAGLVAWPVAEPDFVAELLGGTRPRWTPYEDPRALTMAAAYDLLLGVGATPDDAAGPLWASGGQSR